MSPKVLEEMLAKHSPTNSRGGGSTLPDIKMSIDVVREEALATLTPLHVGVGVELGCEAIFHSISRVLKDSSILSRDRWTLLSNAFNSIDRGCNLCTCTFIGSLHGWKVDLELSPFSTLATKNS